MLSDTLLEALKEINIYQQGYPQLYGDPTVEKEIEDLKAKMISVMGLVETETAPAVEEVA